MDVARKESIEDGFKAIKDRYKGPPTICVNNAGILNLNRLLDHTDEQYDKLMAVNVHVSDWHCCCNNGLILTTINHLTSVYAFNLIFHFYVPFIKY